MKANELRIGNLIWDIEQKEVDKIVGIEEKRVSVEGSTFAYTPIDEILPIELTEEWLIKFGFIKYDDGGELHGCDCFYISKENNIAIGLTPKYNLSGYRNVKVKYVHQLQNLYFALTGEELKQIEL